MLKDLPAAALAAELAHVKNSDPQLTGLLSQLDEAAGYWATAYPQLAAARQAFSEARHKQWPRTATADTWVEVIRTAEALAAALRPFGDACLSFCQEPANFGGLEYDQCGAPLTEDGDCPYFRNHVAR